MNNPILYTDPENIAPEMAVLVGSEARHAREVLRLKKGEIIIIIDGKGNACRCQIASLHKSKIDCHIISRIRNFGEPMHFVTLAAGLSTGFKFDEVIQRGTELGISRFIPLLTEKSRVKIEDESRQKTKLNRWLKVAVASMKQTRRSFLPEIYPMTEFEDLPNIIDDSGPVILFDPNSAGKDIDKIRLDSKTAVCSIIVGPESGFTADEVRMAAEEKWQIATLGKRVLRTENASPVAVALVMYLLGELR